MRKPHHGFTLIELMIVVAIVAILAAIAYPSYQEQVRRTNRAEGERTLLETAQRLERCYTEYNSYNDDDCPVPDEVTSENGHYIVDVGVNALGTAFTLTAARAGTSQTNDRCGDFTYTNTGVKGITNAEGGLTVDDCWR